MLKKLRLPIIVFVVAFVLLPIRVTGIDPTNGSALGTTWQWIGGAKMLIYAWQHVPQPGVTPAVPSSYNINFRTNLILLSILSLITAGLSIMFTRLAAWKKTN
ncbi:MAG: hypothetical protein AAB619_03060, partial [Patescibacteria group bacterium]